ncbi:unnamed protein product [Merluccius merluccius]
MAVNKVVKYLLFTFNLLFFVSGAVILGVSVHAISNRAQYQLNDELMPAVHLTICVGTISLVLGFLGCCGAIRENRCLLALFFVGQLLMLLMALAVGALGAIAQTDEARGAVEAHFETLGPLSEVPKEVQESIQELEKAGKCCGFFKGHEDWGNSSLAVPDSCNCTDTSRNCTAVDGRDLYATPCLSYLLQWLGHVSDTLMATAFTFAGLIVLGMVFSMAMICQISAGPPGII